MLHLALVPLACFMVLDVHADLQYPVSVPETRVNGYDRDVKVPVVLGVMSRCPDALLCESVFDDVLKEVLEKIDLSLTFVGR